jgi:hypothetical protein
MKQVWKYPLDKAVLTLTTHSMPVGARILSATNQREMICIWAEVDSSTKNLENRTFEIVATGTGMAAGFSVRHFIDTVLMADGEFVFHIYEVEKLT